MVEEFTATKDVPPSPAGEGGGPLDTSGTSERLIDPAISRSKFNKEVEQYRTQEQDYRRRGWFLIDATFPEILVLMVVPHIKPRAVQFAVLLDFTNYDLIPPSLQFVDPFTRTQLHLKDVPPVHNLQPVATPNAPEADGDAGNGANGGGPAAAPVVAQQGYAQSNLVQGHDGYPAFLCVPGTREYHDHPYHTNDPWLAHRGTGAGTLYYLLDIVHRQGIKTVSGYHIQFNITPQYDLRCLL